MLTHISIIVHDVFFCFIWRLEILFACLYNNYSSLGWNEPPQLEIYQLILFPSWRQRITSSHRTLFIIPDRTTEHTVITAGRHPHEKPPSSIPARKTAHVLACIGEHIQTLRASRVRVGVRMLLVCLCVRMSMFLWPCAKEWEFFKHACSRENRRQTVAERGVVESCQHRQCCSHRRRDMFIRIRFAKVVHNVAASDQSIFLSRFVVPCDRWRNNTCAVLCSTWAFVEPFGSVQCAVRKVLSCE